MENEVKKILLTYKVLSEIKKDHKNTLLREASWSEVKSGIVAGLDDEFEKIVNEFKRQMSKYGCYSTFTSGTDKTRKNATSLHRVGKAIDVRTYDHASPPVSPYLSADCVAKAYKVCDNLSKTYPGLKCVHEKTRSQSSEDFTAPHFHIEYAGSGSTDTKTSQYKDEYTTSMLKGTFDKVVKRVGSQIVNPLLKTVGAITENFNFGGSHEISSSGVIIIKANTGTIKSPIDGKISKEFSLGCKNKILIKSFDERYSIKFCGITNPVITPNTISKGDKLGTSTEDVEVTLLSKVNSKVKWGSKSADELLNPEKSYKRKENDRYRDPLIPDLINLMLSPLKGDDGKFDFVSPTSGKLPKPWRGVTQKKLNEDLQRIKKLLK